MTVASVEVGTINISMLSVIPRLHDEAGSTSWLYERS